MEGHDPETQSRQELLDEVVRLYEEFDNATQVVEAAQDELKRKEETIEQLKQTQESLIQAAISEERESKELLERKLKEKDDVIKNLKTRLAQAENDKERDLTTAYEKIEQLSDAVVSLQNEVQSKEHEIADLTHKLEGFEEQLDNALEGERAKVVKLTNQIRMKDEVISGLRGHINETENEKGRLEEEKNEALVYIQKYRDGYNLQDAIREIREKNQQLLLRENDIARLSDRISELSDNDPVLADIHSSKAKPKKANAVVEENRALKKELQTRMDEISRLASKIVVLEARPVEKPAESAAVLDEIRALKGQFEETFLLKQEIERLTRQNSDMAEQQRSRIESSGAEDGNAKVQELSAEVRVLQRQLNAQYAENERLSKQYSELLGGGGGGRSFVVEHPPSDAESNLEESRSAQRSAVAEESVSGEAESESAGTVDPALVQTVERQAGEIASLMQEVLSLRTALLLASEQVSGLRSRIVQLQQEKLPPPAPSTAVETQTEAAAVVESPSRSETPRTSSPQPLLEDSKERVEEETQTDGQFDPTPSGGHEAFSNRNAQMSNLSEGIISKKNLLIAKYRKKLADKRTEFDKMRAEDRYEYEALIEELTREKLTALERLKEVSTLVSQPTAWPEDGRMAQLIEQLDESQKSISELKSLNRDMDVEIRGSRREVEVLRQRAVEWQAEAEGARQEVIRLQAVVQNSEMDLLIKKLKQELEKKNRTMSGLRREMVKVKQDLADTLLLHEDEKRRFQNKIQRSMTVAPTSSGAASKETEEQLLTLQHRLGVAQKKLGALKSAKDTISQLTDRLQVAEDEVESRKSTIQSLRSKIASLEKALAGKQHQLDSVASTTKTMSATASASSTKKRALEKRISVLEAQNEALRSAAREAEAKARAAMPVQARQEEPQKTSRSDPVVRKLNNQVMLLQKALEEKEGLLTDFYNKEKVRTSTLNSNMSNCRKMKSRIGVLEAMNEQLKADLESAKASAARAPRAVEALPRSEGRQKDLSSSVKKLRSKVAALEKALAEKEEELASAMAKEPAPTRVQAAPPDKTRQLSKRVSSLETENEQLRLELEDAKKERQKPVEALPRSDHDSGRWRAKAAALEREVVEIKRENEKLRSELSAFDLEFFEEIEDLKYKYAETVRENKRLRSGQR